MLLNANIRRATRRAGIAVLLTAVFSAGFPASAASPSPAGPTVASREKPSDKERAAREAAAAKRAAAWTTEARDSGPSRIPKIVDGANGSHDMVTDNRVPPGKPVTTDAASRAVPPPAAAYADKGKTEPANRKEVTGKRSATTKTWDNGDATFTTEVAAQPIHFKDASGQWVDYDSTLVPAAGGRLSRKAGDLGVDVANKASDPALGSVDFGNGRNVSFGLEGAAGVSAEATGAKATYRGAVNGVDVELQARPHGLKEALVLSSPNVADTYSFPLRLKGLSASLEPDGSVALRDDRDVVGRIPAGYMEDSSLSAEAGIGAVSHGVTYELQPQGRNTTLVVRLDRAWLNDPARVYPVRVDPSIEWAWAPASDDTYVYPGSTANVSSTTQLRIGKDPNTGTYNAAYLQFPRLSQELHGSGFKILDAELALKEVYAPSCAPRGVGIYKVTEAWDGTTMTFNDAADFDGDPEHKDWKSYVMGADGCPAGWVYYGPQHGTGSNLVGWVEGWISDPASNHGLTIRVDPGSESDTNAFKIFKSYESDEWPLLKVKWTGYQGGAVAFGSFNPTVTATKPGSIPVYVENTGAVTWFKGSDVKLGYHVAYDGQTCTRPDQTGCFRWDNYHTPLSVDVPPGQGTWVTARVDPLPVGTYSLFWDMVVEGDQYPWFSDAGLAPKALNGVVSAAQITTAAPLDWSQVSTTTPTLSGVDPLPWTADG